MADKNNSQVILAQIEKNIPKNEHFSALELIQLKELSLSEEDTVRSAVAILLASFTEKTGEEILIDLAKDADSLVRTEAVDSLSFSSSKETLALLKSIAVIDCDEMVRGYSNSSVGRVALKINREKETVEFLEQRLLKETAVFVRIKILASLCFLGKHEHFTELLNYLDTEDYRNRCAVVNNLKGIVNKESKEKVIQALKKRLTIEEAPAVISSIEKLVFQLG